MQYTYIYCVCVYIYIIYTHTLTLKRCIKTYRKDLRISSQYESNNNRRRSEVVWGSESATFHFHKLPLLYSLYFFIFSIAGIPPEKNFSFPFLLFLLPYASRLSLHEFLTLEMRVCLTLLCLMLSLLCNYYAPTRGNMRNTFIKWIPIQHVHNSCLHDKSLLDFCLFVITMIYNNLSLVNIFLFPICSSRKPHREKAEFIGYSTHTRTQIQPPPVFFCLLFTWGVRKTNHLRLKVLCIYTLNKLNWMNEKLYVIHSKVYIHVQFVLAWNLLV